MTMTSLPSFTDGVDGGVFLEPLNGPAYPKKYLDRFPDTLYNKAPDTHFMRFMHALLGPSGVGWLKQNLLEARLELEAHGLDQFDLERFYGDPFSFGRILTENFDDDLTGLLPASTVARIRAQDEAYRARAIRFLNAARLGTSPEGMKLAAESGIGQNAEVVENYRYLFDIHSDDPLGLRYYGSSLDLGEFIIIPRPMVSRSITQTISFDSPIVAGYFKVSYNGYSVILPYTVTASQLQSALQALPTLGTATVAVTGGPIPTPFVVTFTGKLANQSVYPLVITSDPNNVLVNANGEEQGIHLTATVGATDPSTEVANISSADQHHMQVAIDYLRPVGSYPTFSFGRGHHQRQQWQSVMASSEFTQVTQFVTGSPQISWPLVDNVNWIEPAIENEAPILHGDLQHHYVGFHPIANIAAYTDQIFEGTDAASLPLLFPITIPADNPLLSKYNSEHVGSFTPQIGRLMPFYAQFTNSTTVFSAKKALADYTNPPGITGQTQNGTAVINRAYPANYINLQGAPVIKRQDEAFWASLERPRGADNLELDFGSVQAVNYLAFEVSRKPVDITISYDLLDQAPFRKYSPVTPLPSLVWNNAIFFDSSEQSPWIHLEFHFDDGQEMIFTRFIKVTITRRSNIVPSDNFLFDPVTQTQTPWSIEIRNLRVGRNVAPTIT